MDKLTLESHALKLEVAQLSSLDGLVADLSREVSRLSRDLAFVTKPDSASLNSAPAHSSRQIMPHSNPFECLSGTNLNGPAGQGKGHPDSNPNPTQRNFWGMGEPSLPIR